jgi:hypothetical protein
MYGVVRDYLAPKQAYFTLQRLASNLAGCTAQPGNVNLLSSSGFNSADFKSVLFQGPGGKTVAALWIGNHDIYLPLSGTVSISFHLAGGAGSHYALNVVSGNSFPLPSLDSNYTFWVNNLQISDEPVLIFVQ